MAFRQTDELIRRLEKLIVRIDQSNDERLKLEAKEFLVTFKDFLAPFKTFEQVAQTFGLSAVAQPRWDVTLRNES